MLSAYDYKINFKHSKEHGNTDGLSRLPPPSNEPTVVKEGVTIFNVGQLQALPLTFQDIKLAAKRHATLSRVLDDVKSSWPKEVLNDVQPFVQGQTELSVENDRLLWGTRVVICKSLQDTLLKSLHDNHPSITRMKTLAHSYFWWIGVDKDIENLGSPVKIVKRLNQIQQPHHYTLGYGQMLPGPVSMGATQDRSLGKCFL